MQSRNVGRRDGGGRPGDRVYSQDSQRNVEAPDRVAWGKSIHGIQATDRVPEVVRDT